MFDETLADRPVCAIVPPDAKPGESQMQLDSGSGTVLRVTVPKEAQPGDELRLERSEGAWRVKLARFAPDVSDNTSEAKTGGACEDDSRVDGVATPVALTRISADAGQSFDLLAAAARAAGAYVSPKLQRGMVSPQGFAGMVAAAAIMEGEELVRVPLSQCLAPSTMRTAMPDLFGEVVSLPGLSPTAARDAAQCACLATLMAEALESTLAGKQVEPSGHALSLWNCYCTALLGEDFEDHPYWRAIDGESESRQTMRPSRELDHAGAMASDVLAIYGLIADHPATRDIFGARVKAGIFFQARLCMLSRVFHCAEKSTLVPVVDLFNHSSCPGLAYHLDEEAAVMVVSALRHHQEREGLFISYGPRPNVLLLRSYGFTLPPEEEPSWAFILQGPKPQELYDEFLPEALADLCLHLDTGEVQESLASALAACRTRRRSPSAFLRAVCRWCLAPYEDDAELRPTLDALIRVRMSDPRSGAWWLEVDVAESSAWFTACLRVKMSEYLCLTAHLEAAECAEGRLDESRMLQIDAVAARDLARQLATVPTE